MAIRPGPGPFLVRLRAHSRALWAAERSVVSAGFPAGVSGTPTPTTLRIGETIDIDIVTLDEFGDEPVINSFTSLASSNTSVFSVAVVAENALLGTATVRLTGLAPGSGKLTQVSAVAYDQPTPFDILDVTVLDASAISIVQGVYPISHNPLATVTFDEENQVITFAGVDSENPLISLIGVPVDVRHVFGAPEPSYGVYDIEWTSANGAVEFCPYGDNNPSDTTASGVLALNLRALFSMYLDLGGEETVTVTATNSSGAMITGSVTIRVRLAATVEAAVSS